MNKFCKYLLYSSLIVIVLTVGAISLGVDHILNSYVIEKAKNDSLNLGRWIYFSSRDAFAQIGTEDGKTLSLRDGSGDIRLHLNTQFIFFPIESIVLYNTSGTLLHQTAISDVTASHLPTDTVKAVLAGNVYSYQLHNPSTRIESDLPDNLRTRFAVYDSQKTPLGIFEIEVNLATYRRDAEELLTLIVQLSALIFSVVAVIIFIVIRVWRINTIIVVPEQTLPDILTVCSVCNRFQDEEGRWSTVDVEYRYHNRSVSHTVCPACLSSEYGN